MQQPSTLLNRRKSLYQTLPGLSVKTKASVPSKCLVCCQHIDLWSWMGHCLCFCSTVDLCRVCVFSLHNSHSKDSRAFRYKVVLQPLLWPLLLLNRCICYQPFENVKIMMSSTRGFLHTVSLLTMLTVTANLAQFQPILFVF